MIPGYYTSIAYMLLAVLLSAAPQSVVFSGFHSSAVWLVFGGLVLGLGVRESGLGARAVRTMLAYFPRSYFGTVAAVTYVGAVMGFVIPSAVGRVVLLVPIVVSLAVARRLGRRLMLFSSGPPPEDRALRFTVRHVLALTAVAAGLIGSSLATQKARMRSLWRLTS